MTGGQRLAGLDLTGVHQLRRGERPHPPDILAGIDVTHGRIRRAQVDAHQVAAGLFEFVNQAFLRRHVELVVLHRGEWLVTVLVIRFEEPDGVGQRHAQQQGGG